MEETELNHRKSIRVKSYDYSQPGYYFVTVCAYERQCLFGEIINGEMVLNEYGCIVKKEWLRTGDIRANIELNLFVIMPNHIHGIMVIEGAHGNVPLRQPQVERFGQSTKNSLPTIVKLFKSTTTKHINHIRNTPGKPVWQRNYYEHIIRNDEDLYRVQEYIQNNPRQWELDAYYPVASI